KIQTREAGGRLWQLSEAGAACGLACLPAQRVAVEHTAGAVDDAGEPVLTHGVPDGIRDIVGDEELLRAVRAGARGAEALSNSLALVDGEGSELADGAGGPETEASRRAGPVVEVDDVRRAHVAKIVGREVDTAAAGGLLGGRRRGAHRCGAVCRSRCGRLGRGGLLRSPVLTGRRVVDGAGDRLRVALGEAASLGLGHQWAPIVRLSR